MPLYRYVKAPIAHPSQPTQRPQARHSIKTIATKLASPIFITLGSIVLANVAWPIVSYQLFTSPHVQKQTYLSPVSPDYIGGKNSTPNTQTNPDLTTTPQVLGADIDYTDPQNWFPTAKFDHTQPVTTYTISIPTLDIKDAQVLLGGTDLEKHLIQYPGTAKPGQLGSPVIFGHSILRQFYNPSIDNPQRYVSIFSKIMTLKNGDRIFVDYDGIRYTYEVKDKVEVHPEDLFILEQHYNNRQLKLITCVPEGTYLRRGVIIASLVDLTNTESSRSPTN
jgi:sortase A